MTPVAPEARPSQLAQWVAIAVTAIMSVALAVALPRLADASAPEDTVLVAGERATAGGVSIEPAEGWSLTGGTDFFIISKQDAKLLLSPPAEDARTAEESVTQLEDLYTSDKSLQVTLGDINSFTTESGLDAASVTVAEQDAITILVAFSDGAMLSSGTLSISPATYTDLNEEIDSMLTTVAFSEGSGS